MEKQPNWGREVSVLGFANSEDFQGAHNKPFFFVTSLAGCRDVGPENSIGVRTTSPRCADILLSVEAMLVGISGYWLVGSLWRVPP